MNNIFFKVFFIHIKKLGNELKHNLNITLYIYIYNFTVLYVLHFNLK